MVDALIARLKRSRFWLTARPAIWPACPCCGHGEQGGCWPQPRRAGAEASTLPEAEYLVMTTRKPSVPHGRFGGDGLIVRDGHRGVTFIGWKRARPSADRHLRYHARERPTRNCREWRHLVPVVKAFEGMHQRCLFCRCGALNFEGKGICRCEAARRHRAVRRGFAAGFRVSQVWPNRYVAKAQAGVGETGHIVACQKLIFGHGPRKRDAGADVVAVLIGKS